MSQPNKLRRVPVLLIGAGGVGAELLRALVRARTLHAQRYNLRLAAVAVADSSAAVACADMATSELSDAQITSLIEHKAKGQRLDSLKLDSSSALCDPKRPGEAAADFLERCARECSSKAPETILVDCTATDATIPALLLAARLGSTLRATMANKKPVSDDIGIYERLALARPRLRFESTVGAGLPVVAAVERTLAAADNVHSIAGSFSGTLGYVMSALQAGEPFSEVVTRAKGLGYTEPDPRDDLGGVDVARKALILARILGSRLNLSNVEVEPLYPPSMSECAVADFMAQLPTLDADMAERVAKAAAKQCVLRYAAHVDMVKGTLKVGLREVEATSPLGSLQGTDNLVEVYSDVYPKSPLVIRGAGAGVESTAAGVLADVLELANVRD